MKKLVITKPIAQALANRIHSELENKKSIDKKEAKRKDVEEVENHPLFKIAAESYETYVKAKEKLEKQLGFSALTASSSKVSVSLYSIEQGGKRCKKVNARRVEVSTIVDDIIIESINSNDFDAEALIKNMVEKYSKS